MSCPISMWMRGSANVLIAAAAIFCRAKGKSTPPTTMGKHCATSVNGGGAGNRLALSGVLSSTGCSGSPIVPDSCRRVSDRRNARFPRRPAFDRRGHWRSWRRCRRRTRFRPPLAAPPGHQRGTSRAILRILSPQCGDHYGHRPEIPRAGTDGSADPTGDGGVDNGQVGAKDRLGRLLGQPHLMRRVNAAEGGGLLGCAHVDSPLQDSTALVTALG
jgi:hypothetical protein